jgi:hypothetical protein
MLYRGRQPKTYAFDAAGSRPLGDGAAARRHYSRVFTVLSFTVVSHIVNPALGVRSRLPGTVCKLLLLLDLTEPKLERAVEY